MDFYIFRDQFNTWETDCHKQFNNIYFGNGDGTFRRPSVEEQSEIFGNYGCEIQSYFFDFEGESYRTFFTHKYSKHFSGTRAVYVGVEKIATKAEKAKRIAEEAAEAAAQAAEEELIEKELAKLEAELLEENKSSPLFDGRYSFDLLRYHDDEDWQELGSGFVEINNGIMTVAKEGRTLDTGSIDLYDSFAGQINKKGNIISSMKISALFGVDSTPSVDLNGSIDSQLQGKWDHYFDVILKLGEKE
jgi:hypothetical protein